MLTQKPSDLLNQTLLRGPVRGGLGMLNGFRQKELIGDPEKKGFSRAGRKKMIGEF